MFHYVIGGFFLLEGTFFTAGAALSLLHVKTKKNDARWVALIGNTELYRKGMRRSLAVGLVMLLVGLGIIFL